jgi:transcriptional regulator with XRE-family HTH domain
MTRPRRDAKLPEEQCVIAGANIRVLRQRNGWTQAKLGELMGWPSSSTVCAAEGRRSDRQRRFRAREIEQLAALFGISPDQLTTRCVNCGGHPPAGFACLACGAAPGGDGPPASSIPGQVQERHVMMRG